MNVEELISSQQFTEMSLGDTLLNLILCMLTVSAVAWYYKRYSSVLGGKTHVGSVLPLIGLTVFLVITVVKSSLALSLGLVGALSIVRFRTPIKEPEELGFLFLTIAIGLGFGAGFQLITISVTAVILLFLRSIVVFSNRGSMRGEYTVVLRTKIESYSIILNICKEKFTAMKIDRIESIEDIFEVYLSVSVEENIDISEILQTIREVDSSAGIHWVEAGVNW